MNHREPGFGSGPPVVPNIPLIQVSVSKRNNCYNGIILFRLMNKNNANKTIAHSTLCAH